MAAENLSPSELWAKSVRIVKDRINSRSLWETMEQTVGIIIEDGTFIAGLPAGIFNQAGHLNASDHRNAIEKALASVGGAPLRFRVIEGDSLGDWLLTKKREEAVARMRTESYARRSHDESAAQGWDGFIEQIQKSWSSTPLRQLPQAKARFLKSSIESLNETMSRIRSEQTDETDERLLARAIDKIAQCADVSPVFVAFELHRLRETTPE